MEGILGKTKGLFCTVDQIRGLVDGPFDSTPEGIWHNIEALAKKNVEDAIVKIIYYLPANARDKVDTAVINHACMKAWHLIGIICVRELAVRSKRPALKVEMDLATLLNNYFDNKPDLKSQKAELVKLALTLETEVKENLDKQ